MESKVLSFLFPAIYVRESTPAEEFNLHVKRWAILVLLFLYNIVGLVHCIEYLFITDVVAKYYSISNVTVYWSTVTFSLICILLSIPGSYFMDRLGLRVTLLTGIVGMSVGAWVKVASVEPNRFWMFIIGQGIIAVSLVLVLPTPPKVANVWFGSKEVFFACGIGTAAIQVGIALGISIPPLMVKLGEPKDMEKDLHNIAYPTAICTSLLTFFIYFYFDDAPPSPPSIAQSQIQESKTCFEYKNALWRLCKNKSFVLLVIIHGVNVALITSIVILLNKIIILVVYPDTSNDMGFIRLAIICTGAVSTTICGCLVSKFGKLKIISMIVYISALFSVILFLFLFNQGLIFTYVFAVLTSFFLNSTLYIGFELGVELTYPEPVGAVGGILTTSYEIFTFIMIYMYSYFYNNVSILSANLSLVFLLLFADALLIFVGLDFKRNAVEKIKRETNSII